MDINSDGEVSLIEFMIVIRVVADRLGPSFAITAPMELFSNFEPEEDADDGGGITVDASLSPTMQVGLQQQTPGIYLRHQKMMPLIATF